MPELNLTTSVDDRSLQRRWALTDAEPLPTALPPADTFVPVDLRIWWNISTGRDPVSFHVYAWPEERPPSMFAHWQGTLDSYPLSMPEWVRELADTVHSDLAANRTSPNTGIQDRWSHCLSRRWEVVGADPLPDLRRADLTFTPGELEIWWNVTAGTPDRENRYNIDALPDSRDRSASAQWSGTRAAYRDVPAWIADLADSQYDELTETARAFAGTRS